MNPQGSSQEGRLYSRTSRGSKLSRLIESDFLSVAKAAKWLGLSDQQVYNLIHARVLTHSVHGGKLVVPTAAIADYIAQRLVIGSVA